MNFWRADREPPPHKGMKAALWMYAVPLIPAAVIIWVLLIQWDRGAPARQVEHDAAGTIGTSQTPGGFDPGRRPESTREELKLRGVGSPPQGPMPPLGEPAVGVVAPPASEAVHSGLRVDVRGVVESDAAGGLRIRADAVQHRDEQ